MSRICKYLLLTGGFCGNKAGFTAQVGAGIFVGGREEIGGLAVLVSGAREFTTSGERELLAKRKGLRYIVCGGGWFCTPLFRGETNRPDHKKRQHLCSFFMAESTP